jgi:hypothetical protein
MEGALAVVVGVVLALGLWVESRVLVRLRSDLWFQLAVPLPEVLIPVPRPPRGAGKTPTVRWELGEPHVVRFWADPADRTAPLGLHGVVVLRESRRGVELELRWAPPLTLLLGPTWLALLGVVRGEGPLMGTVALVFVLLGGAWYLRAARRAAAELRWSFLEACGDSAGDVC